MTRRLSMLLVLALACATAALPTAATARTHYKVKVTIRYGADSYLRGKVSSDKGRCFKQAKVVVRYRSGAILGTTYANRKGNWKFLAPGIVNLIHAEVGRKGTSLESGVSFVCDRAQSPDIAPVDV
ncbi:MAG: hypothetical protein ABR536_05600 [Solirubrobacterales bacterium]